MNSPQNRLGPPYETGPYSSCPCGTVLDGSTDWASCEVCQEHVCERCAEEESGCKRCDRVYCETHRGALSEGCICPVCLAAAHSETAMEFVRLGGINDTA